MIHQTSFDRPILILRGESHTYEFLRLYTGPYIGAYVGRTFVTQDMWQEIMGDNPSRYVGSNLPVDSVFYNDIKLFIDTLKETSGINNLTLLDERIWSSYLGISGYVVKNKRNGNYIFLPITGYMSGRGLVSGNGYYWSSTPNSSKNTESFFLVFNEGYGCWSSSVTDSRPDGMAVRPVAK